MNLCRTWLAALALTVLAAIAFLPVYSSPVPHLVFTPINVGLSLVLLFRFGFLAVAVSSSTIYMRQSIPMTYRVSSWYSGPTLVVVALILGLAICSFWVALAGRPVFKDELLSDQATS